MIGGWGIEWSTRKTREYHQEKNLPISGVLKSEREVNPASTTGESEYGEINLGDISIGEMVDDVGDVGNAGDTVVEIAAFSTCDNSNEASKDSIVFEALFVHSSALFLISFSNSCCLCWKE